MTHFDQIEYLFLIGIIVESIVTGQSWTVPIWLILFYIMGYYL